MIFSLPGSNKSVAHWACSFKKFILLGMLVVSSVYGFSQKTYYSYQNGNWNDPNVWTLDPSVTVWTNPLNGTPASIDQVVIRNGRKIKANGSTRQAALLQIDEGGTLDLQAYTGHTFAVVTGKGLLRIASNAFPAGDFSAFVAKSGGTIEYYTTGGFTFSQLTYNNLVIDLPNTTDIALIKTTNFHVNGIYTITRGTFQINDNTAQNLTMAVDSDLVVATNGRIITGPANYRHDLTILGNFTNYGNVKFTTRTAPDYLNDSNPRVHVHFSNSTHDQGVYLGGPAVFYRIHCLKGTDDTYVLNVDASDSSYFRLYGPNNFQNNSPGTPPNIVNNNALGLESGTLRLGQNIIVSSLASSNDYQYDVYGVTPGTREYAIDQDATLWIDGATVYTSSYTSPSNNISAFNPIYGKLRITSGSLIDRSAQGIGLRITGQLIVEGGSITATAIRTSAESSNHRGAYRQSGGTVTILRDISTFDGFSASFHLGWSGTSFIMSGGTLEIMRSTPTDALWDEGKQYIFCIASSPQNIQVSGGNIILHVPSDRDAYIATRGYFRNLTILSSSSSHVAQLRNFPGSAYNEPVTAIPLVVTNNFAVQDHASFDANSLDVSVGSNFLLDTAAVYNPGVNTTFFNGLNGQVFTNAGTITGGLNNLVINNTSNTSVAQDLTVTNNLTINQGCYLQDMGHTILVKGNVLNSGSHISQAEGRIQLDGTAIQNIGGNGNGAFGNLALNKSAGSVSLAANIRVNGHLRLANTMGILDLGYYNLHLGPAARVYDALSGTGNGFGATRMIRTAGLRSDGGLTRDIQETGEWIYPVGVLNKYTPAWVSISATPAQWGEITARPVNSKHSFVTSPYALSYYWRLTGSGFLGVPAGSMNYKFIYLDSDTTGKESLYIPGVFRSSSWSFVNNVSDVIDVSNEIYFRSQSLIDGDYTAGELSAFANVTTFYSLGGNWSDQAAGKYTSWTTDTVTNAPASALPGAGNTVVIRKGRNITVPAADAVPKVAGSLVIQDGAVLDLTTTSGHNFGAIDKLKIAGSGTLKISSASATAAFPRGDFGLFLTAGGGMVEYYTISQDFTLPVTNGAGIPIQGYNKLKITTGTGRVISLPDNDLTVQDSFILSGTGIARLNSISARTLTINGNIAVNGGTLEFNNIAPQVVIANGNVGVSSGAVFQVRNLNTACVNQLQVYGNLQNDGTLDFSQSNSRRCLLTFLGQNSTSFSGTGASTDLYTLTLDKGIDTALVLTASPSNLTFAAGGQRLWINHGTFRVNKNTLTVVPSTTTFTLPAAGCLSVSSGTVSLCTAASDTNDVFLSGKLQVLGGTMNIGASANNNGNDIEYAGAGSPEIEVAGGILNVNGQVRRNATINTGALTFRQSGGVITLTGKKRLAGRALLEVLNPGSTLDLSGNGNLILVNGGGTTFGDLYFSADKYRITGGTITFGNNLTSNAIFSLYAATPLWNLTVDATSTSKTVNLKSFPAQIQGDLVIAGGTSCFSTGGLDVQIGGSLQNLNPNNTGGLSSGGYRPEVITQNTVFTGMQANELIIGNGSNRTDFGKLALANSQSGGTLTIQNTTLRVDGDLTVQNGTFNNNNSRVNLTGDLYNYAVMKSGSEYITFSRSAPAQVISGNDYAIYGSLMISNTAGVILKNSARITNKLNLAAGSLFISDNLLMFDSLAAVEGTLGDTRLVVTNGTLSDGGIGRIFRAGSQSFNFPVGVLNHFTPVTFTVNSTGGTIIVRPVNARHPGLADAPGNELKYYWNVTSSGFTNPSVISTFTYTADMIDGTEANFVTGRYFNYAWQSGGGTMLLASHQFTYNGVNYVDGEYTAGEAGNFVSKPKLYSRGSGSWFSTANWSTTPGGASCGCYPNGNPVFIQPGHVITMTQNGASAYSVDIPSSSVLDIAQTLQHSLGHVSGAGTLRIASTNEGSFIFPGGEYSTFMQTQGSTVGYKGTGTLPPEIKTYQNVTYYEPSSSKFIAAADYRVLARLWIREGFLDNTGYNRKITLSGNWQDDVTGGFLSGYGQVIFTGTSMQSIKGNGSELFYDMAIRKTASEVVLSSPVSLSHYLALDTGYVRTTEINVLSLLNSSITTVSGGSSRSFVVGPLIKNISNSSYFLFPVGDEQSGNYRYGAMAVLNSRTAGSQFWRAQYYSADPSASGMPSGQVQQPIQAASSSEYWRVSGPTGGYADVKVRWDSQSEYIPSTDSGREKLRIVEWLGSQWSKVGSLVNLEDRTIQTDAPVALGTGYFTVGLESLSTASFTSHLSSICNDGSQTGADIVLSGDAPWTLTYTINGSNQQTISNIASSPYRLVISSEMLNAIGGIGDYTLALTSLKDKNNVEGVVYGEPMMVHLLQAPAPTITGKSYVNINETGVTYSTPAVAGSTYVWLVTSGILTAGQGTNTISVTWGPAATTGHVQVTQVITATGCQKTAILDVKIVNTPYPIISGPQYVCSGDTLTYSIPPAVGHSYSWTITGGIAMGSTTASQVRVLWSGSPSGKVKVIEDSGSATGSDSLSITVNPLPPATNAVVGDTVCAGSMPSVSILAAPGGLSYALFSGTSQAGKYVQSYGGGTVVVQPDTAPLSARVYGVKALNTETGCSAMLSSQAAVLVYPAPVASITASASSICQGNPVTFTASGGTWYSFMRNGTVVQTGSSNVYASSVLTDGDRVNVAVMNASTSCTDTSDAIVMTVHPIPVLSLSASGTSICSGTSVTFTGGGADAFNFLLNGIQVQSGSSPYYASNALHNGDKICFVGTNVTTGCADTSSVLTMTVNALPAVSLVSSQNPVCSGSKVIFTAGNADQYSFLINGSQVQSGISATYSSAALLDGDKVSVIGTNSTSGCVDTSVVLIMNVLASPVAGLTASSTTVCAGSPVTFTASGADHYTFLVNGKAAADGSMATYVSDSLHNGDRVSVVVVNTATACADTSSTLILTVNPLPAITLSASETTGCEGDVVTFTATNASEYTFFLNGVNVQSGASAIYTSSTLSDGDQVKVLGVNTLSGCFDTTASVSMSLSQAPTVSLSVPSNVACEGSSINFTATGASTYGYYVNGILVQGPSAAAQFVTSALLNGDKVSVTGYSETGCPGSSAPVTMTIVPSPVVNLSASATEICAGSAVTVTAAGADQYNFFLNGTLVQSGSSPYYYTSALQDGDQLIAVGSSTSTLCTDTSVQISFAVHPIPAVNLAVSKATSCQGDTVIFTASGAGQYTFMVNGTGVQTGTSAVYTSAAMANGDLVSVIGVSASNGCADTTASIALEVSQLPVVTITAPSLLCENTPATLTAGGASQYAFYLNGLLVQAFSASDTWTAPSLTNGDDLYVEGISSAGCMAQSSIIHARVSALPGKPVITASGSVTFYYGDSVVLTSSTEPSYLWSPGGETTVSITVKEPGSYTVQAISPEGCTGPPSDPLGVTVNYLYEKPTISLSGANAFCEGSSVVMTSSPGPGYIWSDGETTSSITVNGTGTYTVSIRDDQGRMSLPSDPVTITVYPAMSMGTAVVTQVSCNGQSNGSVTFPLSGGTAPYQYRWSNGETNPGATSLAPGSYSLTVTDANSCTVSGNATITEPSRLQMTVATHDPKCPAAGDGSLSLDISGGTAPYSVSWSNGQTGVAIQDLSAGTYSATLTDANGCRLEENYVLNNVMSACLIIPTIITPNGDGFNDTWLIEGLDLYPGATVEVFDRWGNRVYYSTDYPVPWDGRKDGKELPMDSYHYVINLHDGSKPIIGNITIVR